MDEPPRRRRRWLLPALLGVVGLLAAGVAVFWGDLVSTTLDPKAPFQIYRPPPAPSAGASQLGHRKAATIHGDAVPQFGAAGAKPGAYDQLDRLRVLANFFDGARFFHDASEHAGAESGKAPELSTPSRRARAEGAS